METKQTIDLVTEDSGLEDLRSVLLRPDRELHEQQRLEITELQKRVDYLEQLIVDTAGRAGAVDEVLVDAVSRSKREQGILGAALQPEVERAVYLSARSDDPMLAEALYPVIGPAVRKMIANMFSLDKSNSSTTFRVEQVLLIERSTGLMLASTATDQQALDDADVVSGMIDALVSFVQDAFEAPSHDGLQDFRVGDLSVLVESGPRAVIASVVRGIPTADYSEVSAKMLERFHVEYADELDAFDGNLEPFEGAADRLAEFHDATAAASSSIERWSLFAVCLTAIVLIALVAGVALVT